MEGLELSRVPVRLEVTTECSGPTRGCAHSDVVSREPGSPWNSCDVKFHPVRHLSDCRGEASF